MSTLHDRIMALTFASDDGTEWEHEGHPFPTGGQPDCPACWAKSIRAVLAETATAQPEADTVEQAARAIREALDDVTLTDDALRRAARAALAAAQPVEPEPDEPVDLRARHPSVTTWLDLTDRETLITALGSVEWSPFTHALADAVLAAGFRRSRPEATHTVTGEQRHAAELTLCDDRDSDIPCDVLLHDILAALGVTVADTPTQAGGDA